MSLGNSQVGSSQAASPAQIRASAAQIVLQVTDQGNSLDALFTNSSGTPQERGLTRSLVYGTIRWHIRLNAVLTKLSSRPVQELDPEVRALMLVGLFQLLHTDIAAHAAVAETVEATRVLQHARAAGLVNAILRRCQRESAALTADIDMNVALRTAHPTWFVEMLAADWPTRYEQILDANNNHPPMWLRVNRQRTSVTEYLQRLSDAGHAGTLSDHAPDAIRLTVPTDVRNLPDFAVGFVSVQDAAAQLAAHIIAPKPGMRILDACAAPGGKTCHLLEIEPNVAELVAIDISAWRLIRVKENLTRLNLAATLITGDAAEPDAWWDQQLFDRILLDVPCSATGVIRRHPDIKLLRRADDIAALSARQAELLQRLWPLLAPGGRLLYASCSVLHAENAAVLQAFLSVNKNAVDVTKAALLPLLPIVGDVDTGPGFAIASGYAHMDGFYYACLEKAAGY